MANFLKRRDGRPRWSKRGTGAAKENRLPTRAMIQLLRRRENPASAAADDSDSNSDMSTFDATRDYYHNNNKSAAADNDDKLYPILHPTADGTGLEVNFTTTPPPPVTTTTTGTIIGASASGAATPARPRSANIVFNKAPHRTLSPLTLESSPTASTLTSGHVPQETQEQEEQRQDEVATKDDTAAVVPDTNDNNVPTVVLSTFSATTSENPSHLPPLPSNISSKDTTIPTTTPMSKASKNVKGKFKQLNNNKKQSTTQETVSSLWQEIWQRCVTDCYCITNSNSNNSTRSSTSTVLLDDDDDNAENSDYFQFLPFAGCMEEEDLADVVPKICETITTGLPKAKSKALMQLARLCDRDHQHNRIPLVCRQESWNVVTVLCQYVLQDPTTTWKDYRQALLILSNLTLPMENKAVLLLGPLREVLLRALYHGLRVGHVVDTDKTTMTPLQTQQQLEIHLVCAILFNLSFLHDGREALLNYNITGSASTSKSRSASPLHQKTSLLQTLERMMQHFLPYTTKKKNRQANADSVERQAIRWTFGMMRNLCQDKDMARTIGQTQIPKMALELLQSAATCDKAAYKWKSQSLEDLALGMLIELALRENEQEAQFRAQLGIIKGQPAQKQEHELLVPSLYAISCRDYLEPLLQVSGIHGVRAQAIVKRFDRKEQDVIIVPVDRKEQDSIIAVDHQPHNRKHMSSIASF